MDCPWLIGLCTFLVLLGVAQDVTAESRQCGRVGHDLQIQQTRLTDSRFYLNTQNPAPCSGNVTTWEYCYYNSPDVNITADEEYRAPFGIYRSNGTNYELVSETFYIVITKKYTEYFTCGTFNAPSVTTIQQGDVVGACVYHSQQYVQLNLAGNTHTGYYSIQIADMCHTNVSEPAPNSVSEYDLLERSSTVLHLYANIAVTSNDNSLADNTAIISGVSSGIILMIIVMGLLIAVMVCLSRRMKQPTLTIKSGGNRNTFENTIQQHQNDAIIGILDRPTPILTRNNPAYGSTDQLRASVSSRLSENLAYTPSATTNKDSNKVSQSTSASYNYVDV